MLETPFHFFLSKKTGWNSDMWNFLAKKKRFFFSILVYFHWKSTFWVRPCLKTSLRRHTLTDFHDFGINGKRRPYPLPWYQTIILWAHQFEVHKGVGNHPPPFVNHVTKKGLVRRGLRVWLIGSCFIFFSDSPPVPPPNSVFAHKNLDTRLCSSLFHSCNSSILMYECAIKLLQRITVWVPAYLTDGTNGNKGQRANFITWLTLRGDKGTSRLRTSSVGAISGFQITTLLKD